MPVIYTPSPREIESAISFDFALTRIWYLFPLVPKFKPKIEKVQMENFTLPFFFVWCQKPPNLWELRYPKIKRYTAAVGSAEAGAVTGKDKLQDHTVRRSKIDVVL